MRRFRKPMRPIEVSRIEGCHFMPRRGDQTPVFDFGRDGRAIVNMVGYAIIPVEHYRDLTGSKGVVPENHWPCAKCGAEGPTTEGHDPCIANLPGVIHACCGHGLGQPYAMFEDGRVLRGHFEPE